MEFKNQSVLSDYIKELTDLKLQLEIEISSCKNEDVKAKMLETKFKTIIAIVNLEKQRRDIFIKHKI